MPVKRRNRSSNGIYRNFWGKAPGPISRGGFHDPKELIYLGEAVAIEYRSNKKNGGGDGKTAVYLHEFETPAKLYCDERGRGQLYIIGKKIVVTNHGIEN